MPGDLLLTGGTGFLGYYLANALAAEGRRFFALVRSNSDTRHLVALNEWCTLVEGDVTDPESLYDALQNVGTVIHAAAMVSFEDRQEEELLKVNGQGTANLVNMMLQVGCRRLIHVSSVAALNRVDGGRPTLVSDRWPAERPDNAYGRSKFAAEREVWRGQAEGLSVAAVYPTTILGAGRWAGSNTPSLWNYINEGARFFPYGSAGFVDVRDVSRAVLTVLDRDIDRDRFLLNAGDMDWKNFFGLVAKSLDKSPPAVGLRRWQSALIWPVAGLWARISGEKATITRASHRTSQARYRYDGLAYVQETGNAYVPLETTILETGKAFRISRAMNDQLPATFLPLLSTHE